MIPGFYRITLTHNGEEREVRYFTTDKSRAKQRAALEYPQCHITGVSFDREEDDHENA